MAKKKISGMTFRKLRTGLRDLGELVESIKAGENGKKQKRAADKLLIRMKEVVEEIEQLSIAKPKKPSVPMESQKPYFRWVDTYRRLQPRLGLPEIFGNIFTFWSRWYRTDQLYIAAGETGPWEDEAALESAIRKAAWRDNIDFKWLCESRGGVPNIRAIMLADRGSPRARQFTMDDVRTGAEETF